MAMAWVESAVVYYLRTMIHRLDPYQPNPLPVIGYFGPVEGIRVRRVGHFLLRLSQSHIRLAAFARELGHFIFAATAVVGTGLGAGGDFAADDHLGNACDRI